MRAHLPGLHSCVPLPFPPPCRPGCQLDSLYFPASQEPGRPESQLYACPPQGALRGGGASGVPVVEAAPNPVAGWASPSAIPPKPQVWALFYVPRSLGLKAPFSTSWERREFKNILIPWWEDHAGVQVPWKFSEAPGHSRLAYPFPPPFELGWAPHGLLALVTGGASVPGLRPSKSHLPPSVPLRGGGRRR